uniref:BolA family member 3 n=1 Tax=Callorhinchus milii TaxID=7868 RepID=A0A4W3GHC2_CALMI
WSGGHEGQPGAEATGSGVRRKEVRKTPLFTHISKRTLATQTSSELRITGILKQRFPQASTIKVVDISGGCGAMYEIHIESKEFVGKRMVQQHQMVNEVSLSSNSFQGFLNSL